jgi:DNA-binding CsgD family transcriptional regulator
MLAKSIRESPDSLVVGQVRHLREAQTWCQTDRADAVLADGEIIEREVIGDNFWLTTRLFHVLSSQEGFQPPVLSEVDLDTPAFYISTQQVDLLSCREREVFFLLGLGFSNRRIARSLKIAESTVKSHIGQILGKLKIESRLEAGLAALAYLLTLHNDQSRD